MSRKVIAVAALGAVLILGLWYVALWKPQSGRLSAAHAREETAARQNQQLRLAVARLQAAGDQAPELTSQLERLRVAVPDGPDLAQFLLDAQDAASAAGLDYLSVSPSPPSEPEGGGPAEIAVAMELNGGYFQVLDFLNRLAELPRIVVVDGVSLTAGEEDGVGAPDLTLTIAGRLFVTSVPEGSGALAGTSAGAAGDGQQPAGDVQASGAGCDR
ncbi:MAG TPA: type 4a pilus biogenesis protein PilO, partial [Acidimicrobiales bacterium]